MGDGCSWALPDRRRPALQEVPRHLLGMLGVSTCICRRLPRYIDKYQCLPCMWRRRRLRRRGMAEAQRLAMRGGQPPLSARAASPHDVAADGANATQTIKHDIAKNTLELKVASLLTFELSYVIDSPPMPTKVKDKNFMDTITYLPSGAVQITKRNDADKYTIIVTRELSPDGKTLNMAQTCKCDNGKEATATQIFTRA